MVWRAVGKMLLREAFAAQNRYLRGQKRGDLGPFWGRFGAVFEPKREQNGTISGQKWPDFFVKRDE